ncbi:MAG: ABC transporter substrate-binding protein [Dehalococcoidia bacterium]|nr:ABC transporter substrate-binding protein [Dehalococcoidia bacterium]
MPDQATPRQDSPAPRATPSLPSERRRRRLRLTRRGHFRTVGLAFASALMGPLVAACGDSEADSAAAPAKPAVSGGGLDTPVKIGYLPITDATPLLIGHANDFFKAEGLTVEQPTLFRGWNALAEAFFAGSVNLAHFLMPMTVWMRYSLKQQVKVVAWDHTNGSALTVAGEGINDIDDLAGKQIAVPFWYSIHNVVLQMLLRNAGLTAVAKDRGASLKPSEVNLFVMPPPDMPTALGTGGIDGYIVAEPFNAAGELKAKGKIIRFTGDVWRDHACCVAVLNEESIKERPEWSQRVLNGVVAAQLWAQKNMNEAPGVLSKDGKGYLPLETPVINRAMNKYDLDTYGPKGTNAIRNNDWNVGRIGFQPYPFPSYTMELVAQLKQTMVQGDQSFLGTLEPDFAANDLIDYSLVKNAYEKAGGPQAFGVDSKQAFDRKEVISL